MSYTALYRKFRPQEFSDVRGQEHIVRTLKNQIKVNRVGHAYLFTGTRGTGKTSVAKLMAKMLNCESPTDDGPCGECRMCRAIAAGASLNVREIDAASNNGVDNIRDIIEEVSYPPAEGKVKVYIIDEVHMLSAGAYNALLKTLEEPPSYVVFILATTDVHKLPITVQSRCQRYDFKRIGIDVIAQRMRELVDKEELKADDRALEYIARAADGSMRDALSLLDQCLAFCIGEELTLDKTLSILGAVNIDVFDRLCKALTEGDVSESIKILDEVVNEGRELVRFVIDMTGYLRNLMLVKVSDKDTDYLELSKEDMEVITKRAAEIDLDLIIRYIHEFSELANKIKYAQTKRILVEVAFIRMCRPQMETDSEAVLDRIRQIEKKLEEGITVRTRVEQTTDETAPVKEKPVLQAAIPDDVKYLVSNWNQIINNAERSLKEYLKKARLSLGSNGELIIAFCDVLSMEYFEAPEYKEEHAAQLNSLLEQVTGKHVDYRIVKVDNRENFEENYVDITSMIMMDIEESEE
ncbi:MAG: DNA polymerase III subunit gamma/tau [Lachnospiraceae bacterium]|nr:DNA polymerase III subunit gamma/tau [Lachnospiraceae bacterium]